jgi:hypothetical protein
MVKIPNHILGNTRIEPQTFASQRKEKGREKNTMEMMTMETIVTSHKLRRRPRTSPSCREMLSKNIP